MIVLNTGILTISIDVELDVERRGLDQQRSLEVVTRELVELLADHHAGATWGVADPAVSAATDRLMSAETPHEIAILGDRAWVGRQAGRSRFARELARRVTGARAAGLEISTLLLRDVELDDHLDLLIKQGITAVASQQASPGKSWFAGRSNTPLSSLRFGLWNFRTAAVLPGQQRWFPLRSARGAMRSVDAAVANCEVCHLAINALAVATQGRSAIRAIERVLRQAEKRCQQGVLVIDTLAATADELSGGRQSTPARSILRPAA
jgi:hypothetical protein